MIVKEFYKTRSDGVELYRTYSDNGFKIKIDGANALYDEAVEPEFNLHTWVETDIPLDDEINDSEALQILMGGGEPNETEQSEEIEEDH